MQKKTSNIFLKISQWGLISFGLYIFYNLFIPNHEDITNKTRFAEAANFIAMMAKECSLKISNTIIVPKIKGYRSKKNNSAGFYLGNNRQFTGTTILCPFEGEIKLVSQDESKYPTVSYNFDSGKKACFAESDSEAEKLCPNGEW